MMSIYTGNGQAVVIGNNAVDLLEQFVEALNNGEITSHYDNFFINYNYIENEVSPTGKTN